LLQGALSAVGASFAAADLAWHPANSWAVYTPLNASTTGTLAAEGTPVGIAASQLTFDPLGGQLETQTDTIAPAPPSLYASLPQFAGPATPYYFADGGVAVTQYDTGDNPNWPTSAGGLYDGGAGAITVLAGGPNLTIADGSTGTMQVGSIQTIYGIVNGATRVVEVRYLGTVSDPFDEVDQIFNPYSATPQLWQQINTVPIPANMAGTSPLPLPSAATVTEYNTGNNPNWSNTLWINTDQTISAAGDQIEAVTTENGNWDSAATIAANGVAGVYTGVTWIGEGGILNADTLAAPAILGWTAGQAAIAGTGIAGDWVVLTGSDGTVIGGTQIDADGTWQISPQAGFDPPPVYYVAAQQFDLADNSSVPFGGGNSDGFILDGASSQYTIANDVDSVYLQDNIAGLVETNVLPANSEMVFTNGVGILDPTGTAEDVARLYQTMLDRAPDLPGLEFWTNEILDASLTLTNVANDFMASPEFEQDYGSISDAAFVSQLYENGLYRAADPSGAQYWEGLLASGTSRATVATCIAESLESQNDSLPTAGDNDNAEIYRLSEAAFGTAPQPGLEAYWEPLMIAGETITQIAQGFAASNQFQQIYGNMSVGQFVTALYENALHRSPDVGGYNFWTTTLEQGASQASVLVGFSDSLESRGNYAAATHANWVFIPRG
jgi:hypothetical protein